jgi:RNA polymerase sigma-70 factor (ECF subfamily)
VPLGPLEVAWRDERARVVATLARRFRDLTLAEDAVQEAFTAAARRWPIDGVPERPGAWLTTTAHRQAIAILRRRRPVADLERLGDLLAPEPPETTFDDDLLVLLLTCCHPALDQVSRVALTLRHVCGLSTAEIAAAFVVSEAAMSKRLVRARRKIVDAAISFEPPGPADLEVRIDDVRAVIYLVFTEGHLSSGDGPAVRAELCDEAIWLARQLCALRPADDESAGLLALLLLQDARRAARLDPSGALVPLAEQQRDLWDAAAIDEARRLLGGAARTPVGRYRLEAAIALLHTADAEPNWPRIADLYRLLDRVSPSPVVEVNRALAVGMADGPHAGLSVLAPVLDDARFQGYAPLHAVHAQLREMAGERTAAIAAWQLAAEVADNPVQRAALVGHAAALRGQHGPD